MKKHVLVGVIAAGLLFLVYLGIITLAQGLKHALDQTSDLWYWVMLLVSGFGVQAGLFSYIRDGVRKRRAGFTASVAGAGGVSAGSMAACCAHHLSDVLPFLGLSGAAAFLVDYQVFFMVLGVISNAVGITIMLDAIQRHGLVGWRWHLAPVKKGAMILAPMVAVGAFFLVS